MIPNAVDVGNFQFGVPADPALQQRLGLQGCHRAGLCRQRSTAMKACRCWLRRWPSCAPRDPTLRLLLVGGGPQDAALKAQVAQLGLDDTVIFTGRVPHAEVQRYYELIDVLAYPRLPIRLTELVTPLKPLEAMAQGRVFVASNVGGHRELVRDGETGYLCPAGQRRRAGSGHRQGAGPARAVAGRCASAPAASSNKSAPGPTAWRAMPRCTAARCSRAAAPLRRWEPDTMCGIHGYIQLNGAPVDRALLTAMGNVTAHRGPDDEGQHVDGDCGIAMRRLSIIDLAGGHQPLSNGDGTIWLVCNGEIYNYRELREELKAKGFHFKTGSDSEVLLHGYEAEGDAFVQRLNGMFDFALWDGRRRRLLIGRDRIGVKPLYVAQDGQRLAFATEAKALLKLPGLRAELDPDALADYLHLGYVTAPHCMFKGIRKLPPATLLSVEGGQVREWRYWRCPAASTTA